MVWLYSVVGMSYVARPVSVLMSGRQPDREMIPAMPRMILPYWLPEWLTCA
jgi:hypothetical protein